MAATEPQQGLRILLVEDSDTQATLAAGVLAKKQGWEVVRAATCADALARAAERPFDAAVLDYMLPDGDGLSLLDALRAMQPALPVLFLTGQGSEDVAMQAMARGASDYMAKEPRYHGILAARLTEVLARSGDLADAARAMGQPATRAGAAAALQPLTTPPVRGDSGVDAALSQLLGNGTTGVAVYDARGRTVAARLPAGLDAGALGASLISAAFASQLALQQLPGNGPPVLVLSRPEALVAATSLPGPMLVAVVLDPHVGAQGAIERAGLVARKVWAAMS